MDNKPNKQQKEPRKKIYRVLLTDIMAEALKSLGFEISSVIEPKEGELDPSTIKKGDVLLVKRSKEHPDLNGDLIVVDDIFEHNILSGNYRITAHLARDKKQICRIWTSTSSLERE